MLKRLRIKFVAIMMTIIILMLMVIFGLILHFTQLNYISSSVEIMRNMVMEPHKPDRPGQTGSFLPMPFFVLQLDEDGQLISRGSEEYFDLSDKSLLEELMAQTDAMEKPDGVLREYRLRYLRIVSPDGKVRTVFMDASAEINAMTGLVRTCLLIGAVSIFVFFGLSVFLAHVTVKPVEIAWNEQKQFVADASHELKTPLSVITTNAELLSSPQYGAEEKSRFAENISSVTKQMRSLVEGLLELARADNGTMQMNMDTLDLSRLVEDVLLLFEVLYYENGLGLESSVEDNIIVRGSGQYLAQVLEILLDNAMKYSNLGTAVRLNLERQSGSCLLSVENQGESLSQDELKNIFKRFYRTDKARSGSDSYGLGLAIAESIVRAHKGKIWAESEKGVNTFRVRLPI